MHKRATALVLSLAITSLNANELIIYAQENAQEQKQIIEKTNQETQEKASSKSNIHKVYNTEELKNAINNAQEGDTIKVYPGEYSEENITITKSNLSIEGYTLDENPVTKNSDAISINSKLEIHGDNITLKGLETGQITLGYYGFSNTIVANNTKIIDCSIRGYLYIGDFDDKNTANNTLIDGCYVSSSIKVRSSNNIIKNTKTTSIYVTSDNTLVDNCDISFLDIGSTTTTVKNVVAKDTNISRFLSIGKDKNMASNITIERVSVYHTYIGYNSGTATNVSISDSKLRGCDIGVSNRGKASNTSINNSTIESLSIGRYSGISQNTKILSSNITSKVLIGDTGYESKANNTFIETNNPNVSDMGTNTVVFNNMLSHINKFLGQASKGLRIELIKDNTTLIDTTVGEDKIIDKYLKEEDLNFELISGDNIRLNIYDANNNLIFNENIIIKDPVESLQKPEVDQISNTSTYISGTATPYSKVFILRENQRESDKDVLVATANSSGRFSIGVSGLKEGETLRIYSRDNGYNISEILEVEVLDRTAPEFTVNTYYAGDKYITGTSEPKSKIYATLHRGDLNTGSTIGECITSEDGTYSIPVNIGTRRGDIIRVQAYDQSLNSREEFITIQPKMLLKDVDGHWASKNIYDFVDEGYINGYKDNTFKPDNQITRAEFVKIVNKVYGFTEAGKVRFKDVPKNEWYYDDVAIAVKAGYINGKSDTIFDRNAAITRQEAAKIISVINGRYDENYDKLEAFYDKDSVDNWAKPYVEGVIEAGYMGGYNDNTFKPNQRITRAEAVVTLQRTLR